jgi:hypothetical protein
MKFWIQVLALTALLLVAYVAGLRWTGLHAQYAEANVVVNEIKWQRFQQHRDAAVLVIGSSIAGRLPAEALAGAGGSAVNLGLDGCSAAFGAALLLEEGVFPPVLVVEANTLTLPPSQNERTLRANFRSFKNTLARELPFLRAENRPVTVAYSQLKERSDERRAAARAHPPLDDALLARSQVAASEDPLTEPEPPELAAWRETLRRFQERGSQVVLVMLPDGGSDRTSAYAVARRLVAAGVRFHDLKGAFPETEFAYSDGIHLVRPAAEAIARWLGTALPQPRNGPGPRGG